MPTDPKRFAAAEALKLVRSGMKLGLGSGSTATHYIQLLGEALANGSLHDIVALPTSVGSEQLARKLGIPLGDFSTIKSLDLTIDGADEVDPQLNLIKGLGGAALREKIVAQNTKRLIIIVDASKKVTTLGTKAPLPVEVLPFAIEASERFLRSLGCVPEVRKEKDGKPFITDNGNLIYHCRFKQIDDPQKLATALEARAGIIGHGLFLGMAERAIVAQSDGSVETLLR